MRSVAVTTHATSSVPELTGHLPMGEVSDSIAASRLSFAREDHLRESLNLFQTMFERGAIGQLIVDLPSFRIGVVNAAFCTMTGYSVEQLVGAHLRLIFPAEQHTIDDIVERVADPATDAYVAERLLQRCDGSVLPAVSTVSIVRNDDGAPVQLLALMQDRTLQRASEQTQRRTQALIEAAIAALPVSFATFDRSLRLSFLIGGRERGGAQPETLLGRHIADLTDDRATIRALEVALAGSESTSRVVLNGNTYLALNAPMRDDSGGIFGVISVSSNITAEVSADAQRVRAEERTKVAARTDPLTGLLRRSALVDHLNDLVRCGRPTGALVVLDLDDFSLINDSLGHDVGDAVLVEVASRVTNDFPGLVVARYGADEFAVVAPEVIDRADAVEAAERICAILDAEVEVMGRALRITAGVGIALEQSCSRGSSSTLVRNADSALSHAKKAGTGQYRLYDAEMRRQVQDCRRIQDGLSAALKAGQLRIEYQPVVKLSDRRIVGAEALLRWSDPVRGPIAPAEFIPIAEQSGLIVPIGKWVTETACHDVLFLQREHDICISVNVSVRQLVTGGFAEWVEEVLARTGMPAHALILEVTESAVMGDAALVRTSFDRLRSRGVKVAIDDFGTGYSSLARLQRLPVDVIKLDRAFVTGVDLRAAARAMAAAILQVSVAIGASIVAEGVETEGEAATLLDLGYTTAQGYLFGRPTPIQLLTARLGAGATGGNRRAAVPDRMRHRRADQAKREAYVCDP
jgi:diguanylate cyclase (GGDEF)-like protein/PAS domain S-box-containing protein